MVWRGLRSSSSWTRTLWVFLILVISEMGLDCSRLFSVMEGRLPAYLHTGKEVTLRCKEKEEASWRKEVRQVIVTEAGKPVRRGVSGVFTPNTGRPVLALLVEVDGVDYDVGAGRKAHGVCSRAGGQAPHVLLEAAAVQLELVEGVLLPRLVERLEERLENGVEVAARWCRAVLGGHQVGLVVGVVDVEELLGQVADLLDDPVLLLLPKGGDHFTQRATVLQDHKTSSTFPS